MKISVCDDEKSFADGLIAEISAFFLEKGIECEFRYFSEGEEFLKTIEENNDFELIFMDINLISSDGINIVSKLRGMEISTPVIFVTSLENRAIDGYDVEAFGFVVKKSYKDKLPRVLAKLYDKLYNKKTMAIHEKDSTELLNTEDILYIESDKRASTVHTINGILNDIRPIGQISAELSADDFVEVFKSVYVNIAKIKRINSDTVILENDASLPLSRRNRKNVMYAVMKKVGRG
ncbi:MAG: response regulator transcription factor [Ruminiclostridium sp.]|nr:response regulator transcription factor [Ruminiclostridium sp.]